MVGRNGNPGEQGEKHGWSCFDRDLEPVHIEFLRGTAYNKIKETKKGGKRFGYTDRTV